MSKFKILLLLIVVAMLSSSCKKKIDPVDDPDTPVPSDISQFIWNGMFDYYLWYKDVDNLDPEKFTTSNDWYIYLNRFGEGYYDLFDDLLYPLDIDNNWSWLIDDWEEQEASFAGESLDMGFDFKLVTYNDGEDVFGYIRYVLPGYPAAEAGLERGDIFISVDGQDLTIFNYWDLLFGQDDYDLGLAEITGSIITPTSETVSLSAVKVEENPVLIRDILDIGDGLKTAYLMYNSFTSNYDTSLNNAFGYFKSQNVDRLILDLRYNGGGSIRSAVHLASMIYDTDNSKVFSQNTYNDKLQSYIISTYGVDFVTEKFTDKLDTTTINHDVMPDLPNINSLGLSTLYVITTSSTASASEMIINGLRPFINVVKIGSNTRGKFVGSITVKDYYTYDYLNPNHKWAMQPIVLKIANSQNESDYVGGFTPDVLASEDIADLKPLGSPEDPLLAATIGEILGTKKSLSLRSFDSTQFEELMDSKDAIPFSKDMYIRYPKFDLGDYLKMGDFK